MNYVVSVFIIEDGVIDGVYGLYDDAAAAMNWIDQQIAIEQTNNPTWVRESGEDMVMLHNNSDDNPEGVVYQVNELQPIVNPES
jgi:hypothetical protein